MILMDFSQICIKSIMGAMKPKDLYDPNIDNMARTVVLSYLLGIKKKLKSRFGDDIVIAVDSKTGNYWRKDIYPGYKSSRKKGRDNSPYDWKIIAEKTKMIKEDLMEHFPYKVVEVDGAEADDVISSLTKFCVAVKNEPVVIVSTDGDFAQLHRLSGVEQYDPTTKSFKTVVSKELVRRALIEKLVRGDSGDTIPNILSPINSLVDGIRQTAVKQTFIDSLLLTEDWETSLLTETQRERLSLNRVLIDFNYIPKELIVKIIECYTSQKVEHSKRKILKFITTNKLRRLFEVVDDF